MKPLLIFIGFAMWLFASFGALEAYSESPCNNPPSISSAIAVFFGWPFIGAGRIGHFLIDPSTAQNLCPSQKENISK